MKAVPTIQRFCNQCGRSFAWKPFYGIGRYCSKACKDLAPKPRLRKTVPCDECGASLERLQNSKLKHAFCNQKCRARFFAREHEGAKSPIWRGGRSRHNAGYIRVRVGRSHPMASRDGYVLEHRLIMSERLGRPLSAAEVVHHINHDRKDNRPEDLALFANHSEHRKHHDGESQRHANGRF